MAKRQHQPDPAPERTASATGGGLSLSSLGVASDTADVRKPRLPRNQPFVLLMHPERWIVLEGEIIPALKRQVIQNAVNCITQDSLEAGGRFRLGKMLEVQKKKGWTMLDPEIDGVESYLYSPCEGVYLTRWETAHPGSSIITPDPKGYVAWLRQLIADGKIPAPAPYVLAGLVGKLQSEAAHLQDQVRSVPSLQLDLDAKLAALAVVRAALSDTRLTDVPKGRSNPLDALVAGEPKE